MRLRTQKNIKRCCNSNRCAKANHRNANRERRRMPALAIQDVARLWDGILSRTVCWGPTAQSTPVNRSSRSQPPCPLSTLSSCPHRKDEADRSEDALVSFQPAVSTKSRTAPTARTGRGASIPPTAQVANRLRDSFASPPQRRFRRHPSLEGNSRFASAAARRLTDHCVAVHLQR